MTVIPGIMKNKFNIFLLPFFSLILLAGCDKKPKSAAPAAQVVSPVKSPAPAPDVASNAANNLPASVQNKLIGKWIRSDGSYTIEVFSVKEGGSLDAGYFNPNPIHVEKSEWKVADNNLYMRIVLKDINYPGSTYTLMYNSEKDLLTGNYFQAVEGVNYDVSFQRVIIKK
jgi:hypothetical protein